LKNMTVINFIVGEKVETLVRAISKRQIMLLLCLSTIAVFSNMYATQPILPEIGREFGLQPSEAGLTISVLVLAICLSAVFYGFLIDRYGPRRVLVGSLLFLDVPTLLCAFAPAFPLLLLLRAGQGLIIPGFIAGTLSYIHVVFEKQRGMAIGWYTASTILGGFTGRLIGGLLTDFFNWRGAFVGFALLNLASYLALMYFLPESRSVRSTARKGLELSGITLCLKNPKLLGVYLVGASIFFPFIGLFTYLPYYLTQPPFNLSTLLVSMVFVVYLVGLFSAPVSGRISDRYGRRVVLALGLVLMGSGMTLTLVPSLPVLFAGLLINCFGMFTVQSSANALLGDNLPEGNGRGSAVALYQVFFYLGGTLGGVVPGLLWQSGGWWPVVTCCIASIGLGLAAVWWTRR
jgi:YNFM family putative membrane transporter